jgi:RNA polymerase sigma-70 factor (ECF subfamily)
MPTPIVALNGALAVGMTAGLDAALERIERLEAGGQLAAFHPLHAGKADVLRRLGRDAEAAIAYRRALEFVTNPAERRFLQRRLEETQKS